jgi:hypothetical protein
LTVTKFEPILLPAVAANVVEASTTYSELQSSLSNPYASQEISRFGTNPNLPTTESQLLNLETSVIKSRNISLEGA